MTRPTLALLCLFSLPLSATAQVFQWTDDQGNVQFSDEPPDNAHYQELETPTPHNSPIQLPEARQRPAQPTSSASNRPRSSGSSQTEERLQQRCDQYRVQKARINQQLRRGYREPRGNRLRERRRELREQLFRECR